MGDGPLIDSIKQKVKKYGIEECVLFLGSVSKPEVYLNIIDLIIMPSLYEGLPLSMVASWFNGRLEWFYTKYQEE